MSGEQSSLWLMITLTSASFCGIHSQATSSTVTQAVCVLQRGTEEDVTGTLTFSQKLGESTTRVTGQVRGLKPGLHGFHIHEYGDYTNGCTSAGKHFNPTVRRHGGPSSTERHVGDLGNIEAGPDGTARVDITDEQIALRGEISIIGRSIVVHERADDLGKGGDDESLKTGNAGPRVACGIIGIANLVESVNP